MPESTAVLTPAEEDLPCPLCTYNLRGLTNPRCPECGYTFTWDSLREARRTIHPYLFEHHPRHNLWSFIRTFAAGFLPARFWSRLSPAHAIRTRRLLLYWLLTTSLLLAAIAAIFGRAAYVTISDLATNRAAFLQSVPGYTLANAPMPGRINTITDYYAHRYPAPGSARWFEILRLQVNDSLFATLPVLLVWPFLTCLTLLIFRQSMRKARIRPVQILRCCIYAGDAGVMVFLLLLALNLAFINPHPAATTDIKLNVLALAFVLYAGYRLASAFEHYLRFDHVLSTILASQIIVWLVVMTFASLTAELWT